MDVGLIHQPKNYVSSGAVNPDSEDLVSALSLAIASQLQMITEQTKMLQMMQSELVNISQNGTSEKQKLLQEKEVKVWVKV